MSFLRSLRPYSHVPAVSIIRCTHIFYSFVRLYVHTYICITLSVCRSIFLPVEGVRGVRKKKFDSSVNFIRFIDLNVCGLQSIVVLWLKSFPSLCSALNNRRVTISSRESIDSRTRGPGQRVVHRQLQFDRERPFFAGLLQYMEPGPQYTLGNGADFIFQVSTWATVELAADPTSDRWAMRRRRQRTAREILRPSFPC